MTKLGSKGVYATPPANISNPGELWGLAPLFTPPLICLPPPPLEPSSKWSPPIHVGGDELSDYLYEDGNHEFGIVSSCGGVVVDVALGGVYMTTFLMKA